jgi:hypothetical protein
MAQNKTYAELLALIQALAGVDSFTSAERTKILALVNRRLYVAYAAIQTWPRYLVAAQARPMNDGVVAAEYNEVTGVRTGSSATRSGTTVTIVCTAAVTFVKGMTVTVAGISGTVSPVGSQEVASVGTTTIENDTFTYELASGTGTETYGGTATITPAAISDIGDFNRILTGNPLRSSSYSSLNFVVDGEDAKVFGDYDGLTGVYVGYKKRWDGPYVAESTNIPFEFYHYAAHAAYADFLRMDDQNDKALVEEQVAETYLQIETNKLSHANNGNYGYSVFRSHGTTQTR